MGQKLGSNKVYNLYVSFFFHEIWSGLEFVLLESLRMFICVLCFFWVLIHFHQVFLVLASLIFFGFGFFFGLFSGQTNVFSLVYGRTKDFWLT